MPLVVAPGGPTLFLPSTRTRVCSKEEMRRLAGAPVEALPQGTLAARFSERSDSTRLGAWPNPGQDASSDAHETSIWGS